MTRRAAADGGAGRAAGPGDLAEAQLGGRAVSPLFLHRQSYRQRRLRDAARFLPLLGVLLWSVPLLWSTGGDAAVPSSGALTYIFAVWALLVAGAFALSGRLRRSGDDGASTRDGARVTGPGQGTDVP